MSLIINALEVIFRNLIK